MGKRNQKHNIIFSLLATANLIVILLVPFARRVFDGTDSIGYTVYSRFTIGFFGNWFEYHYFWGFSHDAKMGIANDIGIYNKATIILMVLAIIFCIIGSPFIQLNLKKALTEVRGKKQERGLLISLVIGNSTIILGGLLGIISLFIYNSLLPSIIQPLEKVYSTITIPPPGPFVGFYLSIAIFFTFLLTGIVSMVFLLKPDKVMMIVNKLRKRNGISMEEDVSSNNLLVRSSTIKNSDTEMKNIPTKKENKKVYPSVTLTTLLVIINGLVTFLAPMASSQFEGSEYLRFNVDIFGNWSEISSYSLWGNVITTSSGDASAIGTYFPSMIPLISVGLAFSYIGMLFLWSKFDWSRIKKASELRLRRVKVVRLIAIIASFIGGLLGLIAHILFGIFTSTIIQPRQHFPATNTPKVHLSVWYFFCLLCFIFYIYSGIYRGIDFKKIIEKELINIGEQEKKDRIQKAILDKQNNYLSIARKLVFDKKMKTQMEIMISDFKNQITIGDIPKTFQEVLKLLTKTMNETNDVMLIGQAFKQIGANDVINQLKDIKSNLKESYKTHYAQKIIEIIESK